MNPKDSQSVSDLSKQFGYDLSTEETRNQIKSVNLMEDHCAFVAIIEDEKIVGWAHAFIATRIETKSFVEIGGLVVDENFRNKGIGKKLIDRIKEWCVEKGISLLRVRCNTKRVEAHKFYSKIGFEESKEQKVFTMKVN